MPRPHRSFPLSRTAAAASFETRPTGAPQSLTGNELIFSNMLNFCRRSRESGNPGANGKPPAARRRQVVDMPVLLPWAPAFAGATIRYGFGWIHFESDSEEARSAVSKDAGQSCNPRLRYHPF